MNKIIVFSQYDMYSLNVTIIENKLVKQNLALCQLTEIFYF